MREYSCPDCGEKFHCEECFAQCGHSLFECSALKKEQEGVPVMSVLDDLERFRQEDKKVTEWAVSKGLALWTHEMRYYHGLNGSVLMQAQSRRNYEYRKAWLERHKDALIEAGIDWDLIYVQQLREKT